MVVLQPLSTKLKSFGPGQTLGLRSFTEVKLTISWKESA